MDEIRAKIEKFEEQKQNLKKQMNRDYQKPAEIQSQLEELQRRYETTSLTKDVEKKVINEIKLLKSSLPNALKL